MSDKPMGRLEGNRAIYRASATGRCIRALVASRLGYEPLPPPERFEVIFKEGHRHEQHIIDDLREDGWQVRQHNADGSQIAVEIPVSENILIEGHIDGETTAPDERVVECKALSQQNFEKWLQKRFADYETYAIQISLYMYARGKKALYAVKNRNSGEVDVHLLDHPPADIRAIKARILKAEAYARRGELPECDKKDWPCPYLYLHDEEVDEIPIDEEIQALAATYAAARDREKEAAAAKGDAKKRLEAKMGDREKVESSGYRVSRSQQARKKLDTDKMKAELGDDTVERYTVTLMYPRLTVTAKKKKEEKTDVDPGSGHARGTTAESQ